MGFHIPVVCHRVGLFAVINLQHSWLLSCEVKDHTTLAEKKKEIIALYWYMYDCTVKHLHNLI